MKLYINKNQIEHKGILSGSKIRFSLSARTELTEEEIKLANKYKLKEEILIEQLAENLRNVTIDTFMKGCYFEGEDIAQLLHYEEEIKKACGNFKTFLEVLRGFDGEEIVEY